jgi:hypothetical protein
MGHGASPRASSSVLGTLLVKWLTLFLYVFVKRVTNKDLLFEMDQCFLVHLLVSTPPSPSCLSPPLCLLKGWLTLCGILLLPSPSPSPLQQEGTLPNRDPGPCP